MAIFPAVADLIKLNDTDEKILALLEADARMSVSKIAEKLKISSGLVRRRMADLEKKRVISKYTVVVDHWKIGRRIEAYVLVRTEIGADLTTLLDEVAAQDPVREVATLAGDEDALVRLRVSDPAELRQAVLHIRELSGVTETKTLVALDRMRHIPERDRRSSEQPDP